MNEVSPYLFHRDVQSHAPTIDGDHHKFAAAQDDPHIFWDYWVTIRRHSWLIVGTALVFILFAILYAFTRTPLYTAQAVLLIERKAPQILKVEDARSDTIDYNNATEFYKTQYEILKSRALAEWVIRSEGFAANPFLGGSIPFKGKPGSTAPEAEAVSMRLVSLYLSMLQVRPITGTSLVQVTFTTPDPALSAQLANAHASGYVGYGIDLRSRTNNEASAFLQQKLTELKQRLEQSEAALNDYRREKGIISLDDKQNIVVERLLDLNKNLTAVEAQRIALEAQVRTMRGRRPDELPEVLSNPLISSLKAELGKLEVQYASLSRQFKPGFPELDDVKARIAEARRRLDTETSNQVNAIEAPYLSAKAKEAELRARMEEQKRVTLHLKDSAVQYAILAREVDMNRQLYDGVLQRLKEIGVAAEDRSSNIYIMSRAEPPTSPSQRRRLLIVLLGLCMGPAAGLAVACLLERVDNTFKTPEEPEGYLHLPNLAVVPDFALLDESQNVARRSYLSRLVNSVKTELPPGLTRQTRNTEGQLLFDHHPMSIITESYRGLRSSLLLSQAGGAPQVMLVTSAVSGEGKTTSLINTAIIFAQMDIQVLIIDADLRRPHCHTFLKMERTIGLTEHLAGQIELQKAVAPTRITNLSLVSSGSSPPNPAELLGSKKMQEMLRELRGQYQLILIDSSPVMAVSDALVLSTQTDGVLLVIGSRTPKQLVKTASTRLTTMHAKILGLLLNRADIRKREFGGHYHHYYHYYHDEPEATGPSSNDEQPHDFVQLNPQDFLQLISTKLLEALGPMAHLVLNDHIRRLGESADYFPEARREELIERVSCEIFADSLRREFKDEMLKEIKPSAGRIYDSGTRTRREHSSVRWRHLDRA